MIITITTSDHRNTVPTTIEHILKRPGMLQSSAVQILTKEYAEVIELGQRWTEQEVKGLEDNISRSIDISR